MIPGGVMPELDPLDLRHNPEPVCPHCGHKHRDAWEWNFGPGIEGDTEYECNECGETFAVSRCVEITYNTSKIKPK